MAYASPATIRRTAIVFILLALLALLLSQPASAMECQEATLEGKISHPLLLERAVTDAERTRGLMMRTELPDNRGMLFVFPEVAPWPFWMANTLIDLDIAPIGVGGVILEVMEATSMDETLLWPTHPSDKTLEVRAGLIAELGATHLLLGDIVPCPL